jgi:hypothetical protein
MLCLCRKCFCAAGWYGDACEKQSDFLSHKYNKSAYIKTHLETHKKAPKLYWRIVEGELEMIGEFEALKILMKNIKKKILIHSERTPFCLCVHFLID